jgi:hypothetical protein
MHFFIPHKLLMGLESIALGQQTAGASAMSIYICYAIKANGFCTAIISLWEG